MRKTSNSDSRFHPTVCEKQKLRNWLFGNLNITILIHALVPPIYYRHQEYSINRKRNIRTRLLLDDSPFILFRGSSNSQAIGFSEWGFQLYLFSISISLSWRFSDITTLSIHCNFEKTGRGGDFLRVQTNMLPWSYFTERVLIFRSTRLPFAPYARWRFAYHAQCGD